MSVLKTKVIMRDVCEENKIFTLISVENDFSYTLGCFVSEKQNKLKKQLQNERQAVKSKYLPFIEDNLIAGSLVEMNINQNVFLNSFFVPENCQNENNHQSVGLNDLLSDFTLKNNIVYNGNLSEDLTVNIRNDDKQQVALRIVSLAKLKECDEIIVLSKTEKPKFVYIGKSMIENTDLIALNSAVYIGKEMVSSFSVVSGNNEKQILKGLQLINEKYKDQQDLIVVEKDLCQNLTGLNLKKSKMISIVSADEMNNFVLQIKDFSHLNSICENVLMTNNAKEIFEEIKRKEVLAVKLKLSLSEAEKCNNKIYLNVERSEGTNFVTAFGIVNGNETQLIRVKFKRLLVGIKKTTDLLVADLPKNTEYVVYINIDNGTSFNLNINEYGRYVLDCQNSAGLYDFFKAVKVLAFSKNDFNEKVSEENKFKMSDKTSYVFLDALNKKTIKEPVKNNKEKADSIVSESKNSDRVIKVYSIKKGTWVNFAAKLYIKGTFIKAKYYRFPKYHEGIIEIIKDLKNGDDSVIIESFNELNGGLLLKNGRLYSQSNKYKWLFDKYFFFMAEKPGIFELLNLEEVEKLHTVNGGVFSEKQKGKAQKEEIDHKVKDVEFSEKQKERIKENNKLVDSYNKGKSMHNRVYFHIDGMSEKNTVLVSVVSKTLSKRGHSFSECYEGSSVVSTVQLFDRFIYALKNPLKSVSKNKAVEVILNFNNSKQQYEFELLKNRINLEAKRMGFLFSVKTYNQIPVDIMYKFTGAKKVESEMDRNEYIVNESETEENTLVIYSDASLNKRVSIKEFAYAFIIKGSNNMAEREFMGRSHGNYTISADSSEFFGIVEALKKIREMKQNGEIAADQKIEVRCDCLNAVRFLNNGLDRNKLHEKDDLKAIGEFEILKAQFVLGREELKDLFVVKWLKGHSCENYNERVDKLAKKAFNELDEFNKVVEVEEVCC